MELQFERVLTHYLSPVVHEVQNQEETQEIKLSDSMPDIGRVLAAYGQIIARGKEWRDRFVTFSGGVMVWVLYVPEDGSPVRCLNTWIPFQLKWDLPEDTREGEVQVQSLLRSLDARSVSPRKIMVRACVGGLARAMAPMDAAVSVPGDVPEDVEMLRSTYPMRLPREAGEKTFLLDEELSLPATAPELGELLAYCLEPAILDRKVMANKVVFRGNGNLHILYASPDGSLHSWDTPLAFSQFGELNGTYGPEAGVSMVPGVTNLELERQENGNLRLKAGLLGQYLVDDREMLTMTEDAYSPRRAVQLQTEALQLSPMLDSGERNIYGEQTIPGSSREIVDARFLPDFPRARQTGEGMAVTMPGQFQVLYYGEDGTLQSATARWEGNETIPCGENCRMYLGTELSERPQVSEGNGTMTLGAQYRLNQVTAAGEGMPMVTGLSLGEERALDLARPSLILRRVGKDRLWDIAKATGSTVASIRQANNLTQEPGSGELLLVPVS